MGSAEKSLFLVLKLVKKKKLLKISHFRSNNISNCSQETAWAFENYWFKKNSGTEKKDIHIWS